MALFLDTVRLKRPYDVFLSFRGEDVRHGFLADLHRCLLHGGSTPTLTRGLEARGRDHAGSDEGHRGVVDRRARLLRELPFLSVVPGRAGESNGVVEPVAIRWQTESYDKALARHEERLKKAPERVKKWREALFEAANLSGWHYGHGDETKFIESIIKKISTIVGRVSLSVAKYPVGLGCRVEKVISLLSMGSYDVRMIGIWGTGGVGKTTIAKDVYNSVARQFYGCCFLPNVRETSSRPDGLVHLQDKLLSEILWKESSVVSTRECEWFGEGSRIIVTTRDKHVLTSHGIDLVYKVKPLDRGEAFGLLSSYTFMANQMKDISRDLIDNILGYANGLPLAIVVLGSLLCDRSRDLWESILKKLAESPNKDINGVLKISFVALEDNERDIFLDIAWFFKGREREYVTRVLDSCGLHTLIGIHTLIERSLVTIEHDCTVQMHDLIQQMGKDVVKRECQNDPCKRSRLWCYDDVNTVNGYGIVLQLGTPAELRISRSAFTHMRRLKLLILSNARISGSPHFRNLKFLNFSHYKSLIYVLDLLEAGHVKQKETGNWPVRLKRVEKTQLIDSKVMNDGEKLFSIIRRLVIFVVGFKMLKDINLSECNSLIHVPDVSSAPNLEKLNLDRCKSLVEVHKSVGYLDKLKYLSLESCSNLRIFPSALKTKSLHDLKLSGCSKLEKFPEILEKIVHLEHLYLSGTAIKELPASIDNLVSVKYMQLKNCKSLARLPSSIYKLQNLGSLVLEGCSNFVHFTKNMEDSTDPNGCLGFPNLNWLELKGCNLLELEFLEDSSNFPKLRHLDLSGNKFTHMPMCFHKYDNLEYLYLDNCRQLQEIPQLPSNISDIKANNCRSLQKLPDFSRVSNLYEVDFSSCCGLYCKEFSLGGASVLKYIRKRGSCDILLIGGEMPGWIQHCEEGSISFWVPKDLYDKVLGLAFCVVLGLEEGKEVHASCQYEILVNGKGWSRQFRLFHSLESDHVWLKYHQRKFLYEVEELLQKDWSHFQVNISAPDASIKKCGFRLICQQEEDDLKVKLQCPPAIETDWLLKERGSEEDNLIDTEEEDSTIEGFSLAVYPKAKKP
ncbi:LOW QUALITY PROTEIN: hypothetical protein BT93_L2999 [Corymbia citriodora subsp. variegata]|uniref:ADP-ribosyl cyclase/cyclic ADP-ribose hydrolase n=1 Tax=Corymbia citriodora subsp. variegata TaxID=360336 RepID=A0A8T0CIM8_CORYI|nr:LOW QUALITY PROTEIN: hypothetical protein BT93_L2999 [Corymbia citriodora subsp. variegata]